METKDLTEEFRINTNIKVNIRVRLRDPSNQRLHTLEKKEN